jgi:Leucine-rich repeat (LRR) protein
MTGMTLHHDIDLISVHFKEKRSILALSVRDSRLDDLHGLPSGLTELRHLTLDRTGIDLEQIRKSSEVLKDLRTFQVLRETFTEIPENFFQDLHHVVTLALNNVEMAAISEDGFKYLEDSLKNLSLTRNKLRIIPVAVEFLPLLETLDLSDNEITNVPDDLARRLESTLRSLSRLIINTVNCTCSFGSSEFVEWIRSHAIQGVKCRYPLRLQGRDISSAHIQDFCTTSSSLMPRSTFLTTFCVLTIICKFVKL